ncbi:MAG: peptidoglycan DD-metalloendopeptidase family protein [Parafilimonas sp.]|nr:peptidoglycan DD-metalloendopeptidase family protein [Parafilimonas sp.]
MIRKLFATITCLFIVFAVCAQETKEDIKQKQEQLQKEIADLNKTLSQIKSSKKKSLSALALVQKKIAARNELINSISKDLNRLDNTIYLNQVEINHMKLELDSLKANYAKSLVFAYKNRSSYDYLNFIFSATSFNDAVKRIAYLRSYKQYRETQVTTIQKTQDVLQGKIATLTSNKAEKKNALVDQGKQLNVLQEDKKEQSDVLKDLKGQESDVASQIKQNQRDQQKLKSALQAIIKREIAEQQKEAARLKAIEDAKKIAAANNATTSSNNNNSKTNNNSTTSVANTPAKTNRVYSPLESTEEGLTSSLAFENNKGRLPWPVSSGLVTIPFGSYTIPGTKIIGSSDGITISVPVGTSVKSVADGTVSAVFDIGGQQAIVVRHGKYFTCYSNLTSIKVNKGTNVHAGTVLGNADKAADGDGQVTFMVMNGNNYSNPESWLRPR